MPYITEDRKEILTNPKAGLAGPGDLTYLITRTILDRTGRDGIDEAVARYQRDRPVRYSTFAEVVGSLECARREHLRREATVLAVLDTIPLEEYQDDYYLRSVAPYEDEKIAQNGDVY